MLVACCMLSADCRVYARRSHWWFSFRFSGMLADAGHMLTDTAALLFALLQCNFPVVLPPFATLSVG